MAKSMAFATMKKGENPREDAKESGNPFVAGKMAGKGKALPFGKKGKKKASKKKGGFPFK